MLVLGGTRGRGGVRGKAEHSKGGAGRVGDPCLVVNQAGKTLGEKTNWAACGRDGRECPNWALPALRSSAPLGGSGSNGTGTCLS